jgi:8-hydroxy-5-deazaflavin:NADPH oxidoreductase
MSMAKKIGILGTGIVGQTIAGKLISLGYEVMIGTRDVAKTLTSIEPNQYGGPAFGVWLKQNTTVRVGTYTDTAQYGDILFNCLKGSVSIDALRSIGAQRFAGKPLVDISDPLDFSHGMPPTLFTVSTSSLGEEIQKALPEANVVKTLNMVNCEVMVDAAKSGGDATMFLCGNSPDAKASVEAILHQFGWKDILDLGDISGARGLEMLLPIWLRIMMTLRKSLFGFKIVRN